MLISKKHLRDQERFFEDLVRWYAQAPGDNFGLVAKPARPDEGLSLNLAVAGNRLRVEVLRCRALTPGGHFIQISEADENVVMAESALSEGRLPVFLSIKAAAKKEVGDPDPAEAVPRMPYLAGSYELHLGAEPSVAATDFLQIDELEVTGSEAHRVDDYYPPSLTMTADPRLHQRATDFRNRLENLLALSSRAYTAITTAGALSDESSSVQIAFKETMYQMTFAISSLLDDLIISHNSRHPLTLVVLFKRLFRVFVNVLNLHPGMKDYLNARFFTKEMNSEIGHFMASVDAFLLSDYNHRDLRGQIRMIGETMTMLRTMFGFLAQLKKEQLGPQAIATDSLTYRGKTYKVAAFDSHRVEQVGELSYLILDFAAPIAVADAVTLMSKDLFSIPEWNNMQVRLGLNEARGLGETDPVDVDATTFGDKVALHPEDMLKSPAVKQVTLIFRGARDTSKLSALAKTDLSMYYD
jgi:hypothetical protein